MTLMKEYRNRAIGINRTRDTETARKINVEYTMTAMRAFGTHLSSLVEGGGKKKFRFVYLSGGMSERDQSRSLWMAGEMRKIRVLLLFILSPLYILDFIIYVGEGLRWISMILTDTDRDKLRTS